MRKRRREHPVLGSLEWDKDSWASTVELAPGCPIRFAIVAEAEWSDADPAELFEIGAEYIAWARKSEPKCRKRIAEDLLAVYNRSWAYDPDDEEADEDDPNEGPPPLTRGQFLQRLRPSGISLFHTGTADWVYDAGDLFAGHGISVYMDESRVFKKASLFG
jgi:hypothetical protein